jgi:predicted PurR-regulated permease PerM
MTLFLVIDLPNLSRSLHSVLFPRASARTAVLEDRITRTIGRYALGAVAIATIAGTIQGTAAWLLGVPFALALGIIAGLLGLIPQVGATLAAVVLSLVALTQGVPQALIMLTVCIVYQQVENYVLQPTIQGRAADISGFFVIASVIVGAALLGVVGALIAVPLTASAQIVVRELTAERRAAVALAHAATPPAGGSAPPDD